jgi:hypothetical protein
LVLCPTAFFVRSLSNSICNGDVAGIGCEANIGWLGLRVRASAIALV